MSTTTTASAASPIKEGMALVVKNVNFKYSKVQVLKNISISIPYGSRCLLVGDNGAGKSTLLKLLGGRNMVSDGTLEVLGVKSYFDPVLNAKRCFLGGDWGKQIVPFAGVTAMTADIAVKNFMKSRQLKHRERRDELVELLQINLDWRMNQVSDGQRRRVMIMVNLLQPIDLMLLDEVTTDLDVVTRQDFMRYLIDDCAKRGTTIVYATHIFDGMDHWPTHVCYLTAGELKFFGPMSEFTSHMEAPSTSPPVADPSLPPQIYQPYFASKLMTILAMWIRRDRAVNLAKEREHDTQKATKRITPDGSAGGYAPGRLYISEMKDAKRRGERVKADPTSSSVI